MPLASWRTGVRGRLSHRKRGGDLTQTQGDEKLHNPCDDECQNTDLRSSVDQTLAKVALAIWLAMVAEGGEECTNDVSGPGVGDGEAETKSGEPVELTLQVRSVAVCSQDSIIEVVPDDGAFGNAFAVTFDRFAFHGGFLSSRHCEEQMAAEYEGK